MRACAVAVGAVLTIVSPALGEPVQRDAPKPVQSQRSVVLASADRPTPAPTSPKAATEPTKRVVPRVTTCRCGDPQSDTETQQQ